jgi:hypothetical protein
MTSHNCSDCNAPWVGKPPIIHHDQNCPQAGSSGRNQTAESCATCGRTYGAPVNDPDRCGCCLTGLSLDGQPVHPVRSGDKWVSPITGAEAAQLPDGTWMIMLSHRALESLGTTREHWLQLAADRRARGDW